MEETIHTIHPNHVHKIAHRNNVPGNQELDSRLQTEEKLGQLKSSFG
jgi:hypothetical protein